MKISGHKSIRDLLRRVLNSAYSENCLVSFDLCFSGFQNFGNIFWLVEYFNIDPLNLNIK